MKNLPRAPIKMYIQNEANPRPGQGDPIQAWWLERESYYIENSNVNIETSSINIESSLLNS